MGPAGISLYSTTALPETTVMEVVPGMQHGSCTIRLNFFGAFTVQTVGSSESITLIQIDIRFLLKGAPECVLIPL
jgi:hypothetical protein